MGEAMDILDRYREHMAGVTMSEERKPTLLDDMAAEIKRLRERLAEAEKDSERCRDREGLHRVAEKRAFVEGWAASRSGDFQLMSQAWSAYQDALALEESRRG